MSRHSFHSVVPWEQSLAYGRSELFKSGVTAVGLITWAHINADSAELSHSVTPTVWLNSVEQAQFPQVLLRCVLFLFSKSPKSYFLNMEALTTVHLFPGIFLDTTGSPRMRILFLSHILILPTSLGRRSLSPQSRQIKRLTWFHSHLGSLSEDEFVSSTVTEAIPKTSIAVSHLLLALTSRLEGSRAPVL